MRDPSAAGVGVTSAGPVIEVEGVSLNFGGVHALRDVSMRVGHHEVVALVGPNGAGKSSLLNCISGLYQPDRGSIRLESHEVIGRRPRKIAMSGVGRTFQNGQLYLGLSVLDNVLAGMILHERWMLTSAVVRPWGLRREARMRRRAEEILDFLNLAGVRGEVTEHLGYGVRKRVDLGRALATDPTVLLMDEPMAGMNLDEKADMARYVVDVHREMSLPVVIVEHDMAVVNDISDRAVVLDWGSVLAEGPPDVVLRRPDVVAAYIGVEPDPQPGHDTDVVTAAPVAVVHKAAR
jgi:branched-chain amino acid transport system ATP-binding protein